MTKPIGYFVSDQKDADTLEAIAATHGDRLENLSKSEKVLLLKSLSDSLDDGGDIPFLPHGLSDLTNLNDRGKLDLLAAVVEQLRHG